MQRIKVRPAIHHIHFDAEELPGEIVEQAESWGWVELDELYQCLNNARRLKKMKEFERPISIFRAFGALNHHFRGPIETTWIGRNAFGRAASSPSKTDSEIMVPAGWANNTIDLTESWVKAVSVNAKGTGLTATKHNGVVVNLDGSGRSWIIAK